jgi:CDP-glucose 4,6-dehydratase
MGTVHVLDLVKNHLKPQACLAVTSDKCYLNQGEKRSFREDDALGGHDPYSASKAGTEIVVESYRKSFFDELNLPLASARAGNIIGGGDWSDFRIVPDLMRNLLSKKTVQIRSPEAVRPWQHVLEPVMVYIGLMEAMVENPKNYSRAWNIGPGELSCKNVKELSNLCCSLLDLKPKEYLKINEKPADLHEAHFLQIDSGLLRKTFNWSPSLDFETTVKWTVDWYRKFNGKNAHALCSQQIEDYISLSSKTFHYMV